jgi:hypothetical protein
VVAEVEPDGIADRLDREAAGGGLDPGRVLAVDEAQQIRNRQAAAHRSRPYRGTFAAVKAASGWSITLMVVLGLSSAVGAQEEAAAEEEASALSYTVELDVATAYVWRGFLISSGRFEPCLQPFAELGVADLGPGSLAVGLWMNKALTRTADADDSPWEFDPYASYTIGLGKTELKLGYIGYLYPDHPEGTKLDQSHEVLAQASFDLELPVAPFAAIYVDPVRTKGFYATAGAVHTATRGDVELATTLSVGASM